MIKDKFTKPMYFRLWWPALASSVGWALSDMADAIVVGQKLGSTGLAAISLILPIYMFNCMMAHGFGLGGSVRYAYLLSNGQKEEANRFYNAVLFGSVACAIITAILGLVFIDPLLAFLGTVPRDGALFAATKDYLQVLILSTPLFYLSNLLNYFLRNDSAQKRAGFGSVIGNLCDIGLNIFLVLVIGLGTRGAALSTSIGQVVAILIYLPGLFAKKSNLHPNFFLSYPFKEAFESLRQGFATSIQYLYQMLFFLLCNNVLMALSGENGVAIFDLIQNTSYLILYLFEGTSRAMQPILSTYYGEHNIIGQKNVVKLGFFTGIGVGVLLILCVALFPNAFCLLFGVNEPLLMELAAYALRLYCIGAFFAGSSILICNYYQSCERTKPVFILETLRGALVLFPCTLLFSKLGIESFWLLFPATEIGSLIIFFVVRQWIGFGVSQNDPDRVFQYTISHEAQDLADVLEKVSLFCEKFEADMKQQYFVNMTIEELAMAILKYGIKDQQDGYIQFTVIALENHQFKLHLRDNAEQFNPFNMETGRIDEENEDFIDSMGILVLKNKAKEFHYQRYQGFNSLVLTI